MVNWLKHIDWSNVGMAIVWTLFMSFFTYTECWVALVSANVSFFEVFGNSQSIIISLIVNFGLVLMLVFDYTTSANTSKKWMFSLFGVAMMMTVMVYAHSFIMVQQRLDEFLMPISKPYFGFALHLIFLLLLCSMKFVCISAEGDNTINLRSI